MQRFMIRYISLLLLLCLAGSTVPLSPALPLRFAYAEEQQPAVNLLNDPGFELQPSSGKLTVDDSDGSPSLSFGGAANDGAGSWTAPTTGQVGALKNNIHVTAVKDDYAEYTFTGTSIKFYTKKAPGGAIADIYLDDVKVATVDTYNSVIQQMQLVYSKTDLPPVSSPHKLRIVHTGDKNPAANNSFVHVDDFESLSFGSWYAEGYAEIDLTAGNARSGGKSAKLIAPSGTHSLYQPVTVKPNTNYTLTGWMKTNAASDTNNIHFGVRLPKEEGQAERASVAKLDFDNLAGYTEKTVKFNSGTHTKVEVFAELTSTATGTYVQFDDLSLTEDVVPKPIWSGAKQLMASGITGTGLTLTWSGVADADTVTGYHIYRDGVLIQTITGGAASVYEVTGLTAQTTYMFKVEAMNAFDQESTDGPVFVLDYDKPVWPNGSTVNVLGAIGFDYAELSWSEAADNVGVTAYKLYIKDGTEALIGTRDIPLPAPSQQHPYKLTGLVSDSTYTITITAMDGNGNESAGIDAAFKTMNDKAPQWPSKELAVDKTDDAGTKATLTWQAAEGSNGIERYDIFINGGVAASVYDASVTSVTYTVYGLTWSAVSYIFEVQAVDTIGETSVRPGPIFYHDVNPPHTAPVITGLTEASSTTVQLAWSAAEDNFGIAGYKVYVNGQPAAEVDGSTLAYTLAGLTPELGYSIEVSAFDRGGNETKSAVQSIRKRNMSAFAPNITATETGSTTIGIDWTGDDGAITGYKVYVNGAVEASVAPSVRSRTLTGLKIGELYEIQVGAVGEDNVEARSETVKLKKRDLDKPTWPAGKLLDYDGAPRENIIRLKWTSAADNVAVTGYKLYKNDELYTTVEGNVTAAQVSGLRSGAAYSFRVEALDAFGNESSDGPTLTARTDEGKTSTPSAGGGTEGGNTGGAAGGAGGTGTGTGTGSGTGSVSSPGSTAGSAASSSLDDALKAVGSKTDNTIVVHNPSPSEPLQAEIHGASLAAADREAKLSFRTGGAAYDLPVNAVNAADVSRLLGVTNNDFTLQVSIEKLSGKARDDVSASAENAGAHLLADPVDFSVTARSGDKLAVVDSYGSVYVTRSIDVNQPLDPNKSTGVLYDPASGKLMFVPTLFQQTASGYKAIMSRTGNSIYAIVAGDKTFADLEEHWAKDDVGMLATKFLVEGVAADRYEPDSDVTRAQFVTMLVRSLGLAEEQAARSSGAAGTDGWFAGYYGAALNARLLADLNLKQFNFNEPISREEMATMVYNAMKFTKRVPKQNGSADTALSRFADSGSITGAAKYAVAAAVEAGIIEGMTDSSFAPNRHASRAQAAVLVKRLLTYIHFIN